MFGAEFEPIDAVVARDGAAAVRIHAVRGGEGPPVLLLHVDRTFATAYYHWFFLESRPPICRSLDRGRRPRYSRTARWAAWGSGVDAHAPEALREYERVFADPAARTAMIEDYRAGASIDLEHDAASTAAGQRIAAPCLVLWGERGVVGRHRTAPLVTGSVITGAGHFLAEENDADTLAALHAFLRT